MQLLQHHTLLRRACAAAPHGGSTSVQRGVCGRCCLALQVLDALLCIARGRAEQHLSFRRRQARRARLIESGKSVERHEQACGAGKGAQRLAGAHFAIQPRGCRAQPPGPHVARGPAAAQTVQLRHRAP